MRELTVILRTCDRVNAFSGNRPREFGTKSEVMKKCIQSFVKSKEYFESYGNKCNVIVVDDHSSEDMVSFLTKLFPKIIRLEKSGNGVSFGKCVDLAKQLDGLVFLLEDDYLLKEECILSMVESYYKIIEDTGFNYICMYPQDYPDRYTHFEPSLVFLGSDRHYRTITKTTCTFMYDSNLFRKFEKELKVFVDYGIKPGISEDNSINLVYQKYPCVSPIPSLAEHLQYRETLSPFHIL